jgi:hypothetical protein
MKIILSRGFFFCCVVLSWTKEYLLLMLMMMFCAEVEWVMFCFRFKLFNISLSYHGMEGYNFGIFLQKISGRSSIRIPAASFQYCGAPEPPILDHYNTQNNKKPDRTRKSTALTSFQHIWSLLSLENQLNFF